jgi:hypothetical protein
MNRFAGRTVVEARKRINAGWQSALSTVRSVFSVVS